MDNYSTYMQESWSNLVGAQDVTKLCSVAMNSYLTMMLETGVLHADRALDVVISDALGGSHGS